ncbi:YihY/virulence factor BrkB family protein [Sphingomicrobium sp. GRR-S6-50]|uniref:YihY/virulence factor BrkB family protein n=2 Tax=Sphingomicrobium sediminis TaxID=2950949 RepID=A0A9X2J3W1_9SPHN|nr:YihY/virulence factor BrkB family protein [Sphingomicrobium sediminis]
MLALFPFIILASAVAKLLGTGDATDEAILGLLSQLPPNVAEALAEPLFEATSGRSGPLLWFGAIVGMWTAGSYIETIRDVLRRAYGVRMVAPFWEYRLASIGLILGSVFLLMVAFASSLTLSSLQALIAEYTVLERDGTGLITLLQIVPAVTLYGTIYTLIWALTPLRYRRSQCRIWPGALAITLWWLVTVALLPQAVQLFGGYGRTYGSLAGAMVALIFFYIVGFGVVVGAELNAALADSGDKALKGEKYEGPHASELEIEDPGEDEEPDTEEGKA